MANPLTDSLFSPPQTHEPRESPQLQPREFSVDSGDLSTAYANFARLTETPEELVLDFGLNIQMTTNPDEPTKMIHRLVLELQDWARGGGRVRAPTGPTLRQEIQCARGASIENRGARTIPGRDNRRHRRAPRGMLAASGFAAH
jgi:hypothetical protein